MIFFGQSAKARNINHTGNGLELFFEYPILNFLLFEQIMVGALDNVVIDLADRVFRGYDRRDALGERDKRELVNSIAAVPVVIAVPGEITLDVGQTEQRNRSDRLEVPHSGESELERHGDNRST